MEKYLVRKDNFDILGTIEKPTDSINLNTYIIIEADSFSEAKELRDKIESETFSSMSIKIEDLVSIINNMKRGHGSTEINPQTLKLLIKDKLLLSYGK